MELDALPPRVSRDVVRDVIEQHISPEATRALRMLFEYRRGSSLDEIVLGQMWCAGLFQARPLAHALFREGPVLSSTQSLGFGNPSVVRGGRRVLRARFERKP